jgi:3D (Asp-Asp-Asp) domain-containing protein
MFGNKLAPKNVKLCPGCPPKKIEPVIVPKFVLPNPPNSQIFKGETVNIRHAVSIKLIAQQKEIEIKTAENTVNDMLNSEQDILKDSNIEFDKDADEISPSLDSKIEDGLSVQIVKVATKNVINEEDIDYDTIVEKDDTFSSDIKIVKSEGHKGKKEVEYQVTYKDGIEFSREIKNVKTILEPVNKIVTQGTSATASRGGSITGKKLISCIATAYSGGSRTSSGKMTVRNPDGLSTIAVDPSVIPMGSKVYVDGYGYAIAADTGGAIHGNKIDLFFDSYQETVNWGLRKVKLTIIAYPGE